MLPWALGQGLALPRGRGAGAAAAARRGGCAGAATRSGYRRRSRRSWRRCGGSRSRLTDEGFHDCALIGFAGAPFTVACYMVEGGGSRDFAATRTMAYAQPALFERLIALLTEATVSYLSAQIEAGAEAVMLFDSLGRHPVALAVPPACHRADAGYRQRAAAASSRGAGHWLSPARRSAGRRVCGGNAGGWHRAGHLDGPRPRRSRLIPARTALQGNLDPLALVAGGQALRRETAAILTALKGRADACSTSAMASCRRRRPSTSPRWLEQVRAA